jgi:hypothetical protein
MQTKTKPDSKFMSKIGSKGGKTRFKNIGSVGMSKLAKKRWAKAKK